MPIYCYRHPKTGEIIEKIRPMADFEKPLVLEDGTVCARDINAEHNEGDRPHSGVDHKTAEPWDVDSAYIKEAKPKFLRTRDGTRLTRDQYYKYLK